ncbi:hypothetical protein GA0070616_3354 [Micromonospora nigra]|uniref:Uncharacterized protein n=1 Tax=Micromonospora nigra TaxID=145857 RepID=A0A1C6SB88_9ACTN|nr:hypothetical protein [Micromonospora nigra]SCL26676.1 hypothetical protein GA0070616_3354 [Micromonospora nigra]
MARSDVRPGRRRRDRRTARLLVAALVAGIAVAALPGWAAAPAAGAAPAGTEYTEPATEPDETPSTEPTEPDPVPTTAPPTVEPPAETTPPASTTAPVPTATPGVPTPTSAAPTRTTPPALPPPPTRTTAPQEVAVGVRVTTEDVTLPAAYWNAPSTVARLRVTVTNTGAATAGVRLAYTLPAGLTDAGTKGCTATGGGEHRCGEWSAAPGARFSALLRVRVDGDAWRQMPLGGTVRVTATAPGTGATAGDDEGFAVLFPPGPPVPGIALRADEVTFDISGTTSGLTVRLGNTGTVDAAGRVEIVLPAGVSVPAPPPGCTTADDRTRCDLGTVPAGRSAELRLPVTATPEAQRAAPLAGGVVGRLDPRAGPSRQVQMTFRITAAAALATPVVSPPAPTGSQGVLAVARQDPGGGGLTSTQRTAAALIGVSILLVVLALALATTSLRRRSAPAPIGPGPTPAD